MALLASGVNLDPALKEQLNPIATAGQGRLAASLGTLRNRFQAGRTASGVPGGGASPYYQEQMTQASDRGARGIDQGLESILGGGAYKNLQDERSNEQQMELARQYGDLMRPSSLQEALGALSTVGGIGATAYGISKSRRKPGVPNYAGDVASNLGEYPAAPSYSEAF